MAGRSRVQRRRVFVHGRHLIALKIKGSCLTRVASAPLSVSGSSRRREQERRGAGLVLLHDAPSEASVSLKPGGNFSPDAGQEGRRRDRPTAPPDIGSSLPLRVRAELPCIAAVMSCAGIWAAPGRVAGPERRLCREISSQSPSLPCKPGLHRPPRFRTGNRPRHPRRTDPRRRRRPPGCPRHRRSGACSWRGRTRSTVRGSHRSARRRS